MSNSVQYLPLPRLLKTIVDNRGKTVPTSPNGFPLIATNCVTNSSIYPIFDKVRYVDEDTFRNWFRAHLQPNDILFVNKGTPGRVCLVPNPVSFCVAQDMIALRCNEEIVDYRYLFAVLRSPEIQKKILNFHVGLVIPHFKKQDLGNLLIPIRSRKEQENIGSIYMNLSEKIEVNNQINSHLETVCRTLYNYWFVQYDFPNKQGKPYKSSGGGMVWNPQLKRMVPNGWKSVNLSDIVNRITTGLNPRDNFTFGSGDNYYVTIKNIDYGKLLLDDKCDKVSDEALKIINKRSDLQVGDILYTSIEPVGRTYLIQEHPTHWNINESVFSIRPNSELITSEYLYFLLSSDEIKSFTKNSSAGSTFKGIRIGVLNTFMSSYPNKDLILEFSKIVKPLLKKISILQKENQSLVELRDWLLPMLMTGRVTLDGSKDEFSARENNLSFLEDLKFSAPTNT